MKKQSGWSWLLLFVVFALLAAQGSPFASCMAALLAYNGPAND